MRTELPAPVLTGLALALLAGVVGIAPVSAQEGGTWATEEHQCGDCHGPHTDGRGASAMVRSGMSDVIPQAPGIDKHSIRCLQCHGTPGDRQAAVVGRVLPPSGAVYLGGNLGDDHPMGVVSPSGQAMAGLGRFSLADAWSTDLPILRSDLDPSSAVGCGSCHDPHSSWLVTQTSSLQDDVCLSCHDQGFAEGSHGISGCGNCHRMHASSGRDDLLRESRPEGLCGACHAGAPQPSALGIEPIPAQPVHTEPANPRCSECHTIH